MDEISVYIHIPYCVKKCPYCDFNSYGIGDAMDKATESAYTAALIHELRHYAVADEWTGRSVRSIFFGGGTPSLFAPESISAFLCELQRSFDVPDHAEITLEANPGTIQEQLGAEKLRGFRTAGVNRISMGVQSFSSVKLERLGRIHSGDDAARAAENIGAAGFENFNLDLIFGVEDETLEHWRGEIEKALALGPQHLSAYGLTIEPGTEFARRAKIGALPLATDDSQAEMYSLTQEMTSAAGLEQYEISNYARPGRECAHNLSYWTGVDYLGLGAGAHSFCSQEGAAGHGCRRSNTPGPAHYIERITATGDAVQRRDELDLEKAKTEFFFLGLRTRGGIDLTSFEARFGSAPEALHAQIRTLTGAGLLEGSLPGVRLTRKGFLFADGIMSELAASLG